MTIRNFDTLCSSLAVFGFSLALTAASNWRIETFGDSEKNTSTASFKAIRVDVVGSCFIADNLMDAQGI